MVSQMYSFQPHRDLSLSHLFAVLFCLLTIAMALAYVYIGYTRRGNIAKWVSVVTFVVPFIAAALMVYDTWFATHGKPANTQVTATLVGNEETQVYEKVAKHRSEYVPAMFVIYRVPEGEVSFPRVSGYVYPKEVILYRK